jgi:hypothetical protein
MRPFPASFCMQTPALPDPVSHWSPSPSFLLNTHTAEQALMVVSQDHSPQGLSWGHVTGPPRQLQLRASPTLSMFSGVASPLVQLAANAIGRASASRVGRSFKKEEGVEVEVFWFMSFEVPFRISR